MTVRQVFYQATVKGLVEKSEAGYAKVQTDLALMRRDGELPYDWLVDNTRMMRKPRSVSSIKQALDDTARLYRKNLVGGRGLLRRDLAGEGRALRRRVPGHVPL